MFDNGLYKSLDTESRDHEIKTGLWLFAPAFVFIVLPAAALFAYSIYTGRDESRLVFAFVNEYHVALLVPLIMILACLAAAIYLVIVKDLIRMIEIRREISASRRARTHADLTPGDEPSPLIGVFVVASLLVFAGIMFSWHG